jgi:predicted AAA+ superfamily ATPase
MYILQKQLDNLKKTLQPNKVIVIYGPRRCGKTTLLNEFLKGIDLQYLLVTGEDITIRNYLESQSVEKLRAFVGSKQLLVIDEAQKINKIGI